MRRCNQVGLEPRPNCQREQRVHWITMLLREFSPA